MDEYLHAYEEYWDELDETAEELVEYEDRTLFSTWNLSLGHVQEQFPEVAELLRLLAYTRQRIMVIHASHLLPPRQCPFIHRFCLLILTLLPQHLR